MTNRLVDAVVESEHLRAAPDGHVLVIELDNPSARNAVSASLATGMEAALDLLESTPQLWLAVLTHTGPVFCAGADLKAVQRGEAASLSTERGGFGGIVRRARTKPLIAAVDGPALAGGFEMVLTADLVVASTNAYFSLPEVRRGLIAAGGGLTRAIRALPRNIGMEVLLAGRTITAAEAERYGLVNRVCEPGQARAAALELAGQVALGAPLALAATRRIALAASEQADRESFASIDAELEKLYQSADMAEALAAFFAKRDAHWAGA
ncbi:enoyl-CoA hydratase-related protein [Dactylosporangium sp. CA-092794]|uniref:enoyl-CoA hydratase-related protein n=1 Tax=Dactylosporangium sp. CA-092794 TaxID=3239929 RepID=UPI003D90C995